MKRSMHSTTTLKHQCEEYISCIYFPSMHACHMRHLLYFLIKSCTATQNHQSIFIGDKINHSRDVIESRRLHRDVSSTSPFQFFLSFAFLFLVFSVSHYTSGFSLLFECPFKRLMYVKSQFKRFHLKLRFPTTKQWNGLIHTHKYHYYYYLFRYFHS